MKTTIATLLLCLSFQVLADHHENKDKLGHDKEHQHVKDAQKDHDHDEKHHGSHDHKAHHPDHKDAKKHHGKKK